MKKGLILLCALLAGCSTSGSNDFNDQKETSSSESVEIKESPDKYTWYLKNYVGRNASQAGYWGLGDKRCDSYGDGYIDIIFITETGEAVTKENIDQFYVADQHPEPNFEIKYVYEKNSDGEEYETLIESQNLHEIELKVKKVVTEEK